MFLTTDPLLQPRLPIFKCMWNVIQSRSCVRPSNKFNKFYRFKILASIFLDKNQKKIRNQSSNNLRKCTNVWTSNVMPFIYQWVTDETRKGKGSLRKTKLKLKAEARPCLRGDICSDNCLYHRRLKITDDLVLHLKVLSGERFIRMTFLSSQQSNLNL